ncbi:LolA family protein [Aliikangiella coralliicola]|uniref:Outer membrane lipoprotein carrier protein LolA n=1 Tax=Aliikangiella coralliicola TaxID=2592383 RepID=A0A545UEF9_9GAMM|nr:outer membrane lipoprotein carrier protein LolA [Aliikangiella coralliicola]TQV87857.1 outer membrane lipoprotein carrier protein LolA [Aliikangiella coralliicola]
MKIVNSLLILSFLFGANAVIGASASTCQIKQISQKIAKSELHSDFIQTKEIKALSRPLISRGKIWLSPSNKLIWQVSSPLKSTMVIGAGEMYQFDKNDLPVEIPPNAIANEISTLFFNLLSGNLESLKSHFTITKQCNEMGWSIKLSPIKNEFSKLLKTIELTGQVHIESILFEESRGDLTKIRLTALKEQAPQVLEKYLEVSRLDKKHSKESRLE